MKLFAIGTLALLGTGYASTHLSKANKPIELRTQAASEGIVTIFVPNGEITIEGWTRDEIEVVGSLDDDNANLQLVSDHSHADLTLQGNASANANLRIRVPYRSSIDIETSGASVWVSEMAGIVRFESVDGGLSIDGEPRGFVARSTNGNIAIPGADIPGFAHSEYGVVRLGPGTGSAALARSRNSSQHRSGSHNYQDIGAQIGGVIATAISSLNVEGMIDYNALSSQLDFDLSGSINLDMIELNQLLNEMTTVFDDLQYELSVELSQLGEELEALGQDLRRDHRGTRRR